MQNNSDYYSGEYEIGIPYWIDSFSVFSSLKSSVNCLNTKDKIFAPMDDDLSWKTTDREKATKLETVVIQLYKYFCRVHCT